MWVPSVKIFEDRVTVSITNHGKTFTVEANRRDVSKIRELLLEKVLLDRENTIKADRIIDTLKLDKFDELIAERSGKI